MNPVLPAVGAEDVVIAAVDAPAASLRPGKLAGLERAILVGRGTDEAGGGLLRRVDFSALLAREGALSGLGAAGRVIVFITPTRTYSEGMGNGASPMAPEDRKLIRALNRRFPGRVEARRVGASEDAGADSQDAGRRSLVEFDPKVLLGAKDAFKASMTRPNRQDYFYLATKTFGLNLVVRLAFVIKGVTSGQLPLARAAASTAWYQLQDAVFTVFGQTYMKFLGRMTGLLRVYNAYLGDFLFVYVQLCFSEFLNRLVLGPMGDNPLVYTWSGMGLIFVNILQGMVSGGPIVPAINKLRKTGLISHSTMMHLYQLASLTMHFGLFASFGYQRVYAGLTGATLLLSWSAYLIASAGFPDPEIAPLTDAGLIARLEKAAASA